MMVAPVQTSGHFVYGRPKLLFEGSYVHASGGARNFDLTPDGERFIMIKEVERKRDPPARDKLVVVLN